MTRIVAPIPGRALPYTAVGTDDKGAPLSRTFSGGADSLADGEAEYWHEAGQAYAPPDGSLEEYILDMSPLFYAPFTPDVGMYDVSGNAATITPSGPAAALASGGPLRPGSVRMASAYLTTSAETERNYFQNPFGGGAALAGGLQSNINGAATGTWVTTNTGNGGGFTTNAGNLAPGNLVRLDTAGTANMMPVVPGDVVSHREQWTLSSIVGTAKGRSIIEAYSAAGAYLGSVGTTQSTPAANGVATLSQTNIMVPATVGGTAPAFLRLTHYLSADTTGSVTARLTNVNFLKRSSVAGSFSGDSTDSGWHGTRFASFSDRGIFANGTTRTFVALVYQDVGSGQNTLFASGSGGGSDYAIIGHGWSTAGDFRFWPGYPSQPANTPASACPNPNGTPQLVVAEVDMVNDVVKWFINGTQYGGTYAYPGGLVTPAGPAGVLKLGAWGSGAANTMDGHMAHAAVIPRALTAAEHGELYARARYRFW